MKKLTPILIFLGCLLLSAHSYGQTVTISRKNASLKEILEAVYKQTGYYYYGSAQVMANAKKIAIDVKDALLSEVLEICFKDQPLVYTIENKTILVSEKPVLTGAAIAPEPVDLKGKVMNEKEEPLPGATITVKGTNRSVLTDPNGNFILPGFEDKATLRISSIGYETREFRPGKRHFVEIRLHLAENKLDEVQVIAYGTTTKRLSTGDVSTVKAETIEQQPVNNPLGALEGRIPGLYISQQSGLPGSGYAVQIRGQNSLRNTQADNGNLPLYIVDGVPFSSNSIVSPYTSFVIQYGSPLSSINPSDIESIEVLKDADATAIYGSRGANGVVLITTKKGKKGKTRVEINSFAAAGKVTRMMHLLNTPQYLEMRREAFQNDGITPDQGNAKDLLLWDTTRYTDWQKVLIGGTANSARLNGSVSGGNEYTQFFLSGSYLSEGSVFPGNFRDKKGAAHFNVAHKSENGKFEVNFSASYVADANHLLQTDFTSQALTLSPNAPALYDSTGKLNWQNSTWTNPLSGVQQHYNISTDNLVSSALLSYRLLPGLRIKANLGYTQVQVNEIAITPLSSFDPAYLSFLSASSVFSNNRINTWIVEPQAEYSRRIAGAKLDVLAGTTFQQNSQQGQTQQASGYTNDILLEDIQAAPFLTSLSSTYTQYKYNAVFARMNLNWQDKYLLNVSARRDGSSRFGPDKQFANFGAVGAAWIFSGEKWFQKNLPFVSFGKLRGSYGITGSDQIADYGFLNTYSTTQYNYNGVIGLIPTALVNPDYAWETNRKIEASLSLGFLKDNILLSASWYRNRSSNQLVGYPLSLVTGEPSIQANLPALVQNTGWEFEMTTTNVKSKKISWTSSFNLTIPQNKLLSFPGIVSSSYADTYVVGQSLYIKPLFHFQGVNPVTGLYTFQDVDQDGQISYPNDLRALKKLAQNFYGGFQNSISWNGIQLDVFFQFVKQTAYNYFSSAFTIPGALSNQPVAVLSRWQKPGDVSGIQQFTRNFGSDAATAFFNNASSDNSISDASFIRLKNISLSWQLPAQWMGQSKMGIKIYMQGQNLLTITRYTGLDPEQQSIQNLPPLKVLAGGFQLTF